MNDAINDYPNEAWKIIRSAIESPKTDEVLFQLAAGPLEDLMNRHEFIVPLIESSAVSSEKIKTVLTGVYH